MGLDAHEMATQTRQQLEQGLARGLVFVAVNKQVAGVVLPPKLESPCVIKLSRRFGPDFPVTLTDDAVVARLTFPEVGGFHCRIPYAAIVSMRVREREAQPQPVAVPARAHLRLIPGGKS